MTDDEWLNLGRQIRVLCPDVYAEIVLKLRELADTSAQVAQVRASGDELSRLLLSPAPRTTR